MRLDSERPVSVSSWPHVTIVTWIHQQSDVFQKLPLFGWGHSSIVSEQIEFICRTDFFPHKCMPTFLNGESMNGASGAIPPKITCSFWCVSKCMLLLCYYGRHHHYSNSRFLIGLATPALEQSFKT